MIPNFNDLWMLVLRNHLWKYVFLNQIRFAHVYFFPIFVLLCQFCIVSNRYWHALISPSLFFLEFYFQNFFIYFPTFFYLPLKISTMEPPPTNRPSLGLVWTVQVRLVLGIVRVVVLNLFSSMDPLNPEKCTDPLKVSKSTSGWPPNPCKRCWIVFCDSFCFRKATLKSEFVALF